jgi:PKD repeat protein
MTNFSILFCLSYCLSFYSQESLSVLFIGNSYTFVNDMPSVLNNLTTSKGDQIMLDSRTQGGAFFSTHCGNASTFDKIKSHPWDYVVLQGQSQELSFHTNQVNTQSLPYIVQLSDSIHRHNYCTQAMLFLTWGRQNGDPQWDSISTYDGMQARLTDATVRMADSIDASVSPVGIAWKYTRDNHPAINLYSADGSHPSYAGTYLAACTFYAALFRKTPEGSSFYGSLDSNTAILLQQAAAMAVLDSLERWNLQARSDRTVADFSTAENGGNTWFFNSSLHATRFEWDFGDNQTSTEMNPVHTYADNGTYLVQLIAIDSCDTDTLTHFITVNTAGLSSLASRNFLLKNLNNNRYELLNTEGETYQLCIKDTNGRTVTPTSIFTHQHFIDLNTFPKGTYFVYLENKDKTVCIKINKT